MNNLPLAQPGSLSIPPPIRILTQPGSPNAIYNADCFTALPFTAVSGLIGAGPYVDAAPYTAVSDIYLIYAAYITSVTAITGTGASGAGATANILLMGTGGTSLGTLFSLAFNSGTNTVAAVGLSLGSITGISGRNYGNAVGIRSTESIRFQWLQGGTGLTLPESIITLDII